MASNLLADTKVRQLKPLDKAKKYVDGEGLYLLIQASGSKYWRYDYRYNGKRKTLAIGVYPRVSLKEAREKRANARIQLDKGIDPSGEKRRSHRAAAQSSDDQFSIFARSWWENSKGDWKAKHADKVWRRIESNALPVLGRDGAGVVGLLLGLPARSKGLC